MNKEQFVEKVISEILAGIASFNSQGFKYKAYAPEAIEFDMAYENNSRIKFSVGVVYDPSFKKPLEYVEDNR